MSFADASVYSTFIKTRRSLLQWVTAAALCLHASSAFADETAGERLFREARALMLDGRFDEACPKLQESQSLEPHVGTLLNLAACHERQGKVGSAWVEYQKALTAARAEGQTERAQLASERIKVLEPRVPWLKISSSAEDVTITLDGGALERAAWEKEMPVDPAGHVVTAERGGAKVFEARIVLREGERRALRVEIVAPLPPPGDARPTQDRIIVEPKPEAPAPEAPKKHTSPWVIEPGLFLGFAGGTAKVPRLTSAAGSVPLRDTRQGMMVDTSCASHTCPVGELGDANGVAAGINFFAGYALSDTVHLGARFVGAPSLGSNGASLFALGPSLALHPSEVFTIGAWVFFGNATFNGTSNASAPEGYQLTGDSRVRVEGDLHGGFGAGLELSLRLFELKRGEIIASSTPFFLAGSNGTAVCLPIGLAYRFQ